MSVMVKNKTNKNYKRSQKGRSMVEMLGVLAIIGVLSIGGISAYGVAMKKHKANELLHQASMLATTISAQIQSKGELPKSIENFGNGKYLDRPCLHYEMGQCMAPCVGRVSPDEYKKEIYKVIDFLNGNTKDIKDMLLEKMQTCVELEQFEKAMVYRDNIKMLDYLDSKVITEINNNIDIDIFGYANNGYDSVVSVLVLRGGKILGLSNYAITNITDRQETLMQFIPRYYNEISIPPKNVYVCDVDTDIIGEYLSSIVDFKVSVISPKIGTNKKLVDMADNNAKEYLDKSLDKIKAQELKT